MSTKKTEASGGAGDRGTTQKSYDNHTPARDVKQAALTLWAAIREPSREIRCMGCLQYKRPSPAWQVITFIPTNKAQWPIAYVICDQCLADKSRIQATQRRIELVSMEMTHPTECKGGVQ